MQVEHSESMHRGWNHEIADTERAQLQVTAHSLSGEPSSGFRYRGDVGPTLGQHSTSGLGAAGDWSRRVMRKAVAHRAARRARGSTQLAGTVGVKYRSVGWRARHRRWRASSLEFRAGRASVIGRNYFRNYALPRISGRSRPLGRCRLGNFGSSCDIGVTGVSTLRTEGST